MANVGVDILSLPTVVGNLIGTEQVPLVQGGTTKRANASAVGQAYFNAQFPATIEYVIFGGGTQIGTGVFKPGLRAPFNATITEASLWGDQTGSIVLQIWKCTFTQYDAGVTHPGPGDNICGSSPLTIVTGTKVADSVLSGWTTSINSGDVLWYNVVSVSAFQEVTISLKLNRSVGV